MSNGRVIQIGERFKVVRIVTPDPDSYAVIHYEGGYAFPCGRAWFERHQPTVGGNVLMGADGHWCFAPAAASSSEQEP